MKTNILLITTYDKIIIKNTNPKINDHIGKYLIDNCIEDLNAQRDLFGKSPKKKSMSNGENPGWAKSIYTILNENGGITEQIKKAYQNKKWDDFENLSKSCTSIDNNAQDEINLLITQKNNETQNGKIESHDDNSITLDDLKTHLGTEAINIYDNAQKNIGSTYLHRLGVYILKEITGEEKFLFLAVLPLKKPCLTEESNPWIDALTNVALSFCNKEDEINLLLLLHGKDLGKDTEFNTLSWNEEVSKTTTRSIALFQHNYNKNFLTIREETVDGSAKSVFDKTESLMKDDWDSKQPHIKGLSFQKNKYTIWLQKKKDNYYNYILDDGVNASDAIYSKLLNKKDKGGNYYFSTDGKDNNKDSYFPINIVIYNPIDLFNGQSYVKKQDKPFFQDSFVCNKNKTIDNKKFIPIIHLCNSDRFINSLYGTSSIPHYIPRSFMIMDSSIWNYLVPLTAIPYYENLAKTTKDSLNPELKSNPFTKIEYFFYENFLRVINSIYSNYEKHLYDLPVAKEYIDLNARTVLQSYLSGSHAKGVSPYIFHSEHATKQLIRREFLDENRLNKIKNGKKWRILLVDDKAHQHMIKDNTSASDYDFKLTIIENVLKNYFIVESKPFKENNSFSKESDIAIEYVETIEEAQKALEKKRYEILLLDYLLEQPKEVHYGYELLETIYQDQNEHENDEEHLKFKIAPHKHQRLYCMFISAYSSAVHDRLLAEGLNQSEDYWFISLGACPTNTPQLFLYNLLKLMEKRLEDSGILKLSPNEIYALINSIYLYKEGDSVRKRANALYQKVLSLQYHYRSILKDVDIPFGQNASDFDTKGSVLMTNFIKKKINLGGMLEHLTQLVHLTAFGTIRQWPEMWEEYVYFKALFEKQLDDVTHDDFKTMCQNIEKYILDLKSQQQ